MNKNKTYRKITENEMDWIVADEYYSLIPGKLLEKVKNPASYPDCCVIRENNVRKSMLVTLTEKDEVVFAKRYKTRGILDRVKYFFFTSKATSEWKNLNRFLQKGIPVAVPLAKAEKRACNFLLDSYLITRAFNNATHLRDYVEQKLGDGNFPGTLEKRRKIIEDLALLVKKIHDEGFFYRDLHAGNILVMDDDNGPPQLHPVDLHKAWYLGRVPAWMRVRDLAQLKNSISLSRTDQMRFLRVYAGEDTVSTHKIYAYRIERKAEKLWKAHLKSRTKRCVINSSEFAVKKNRSQALYYNKIYTDNILTEIIDTYRNALLRGELEVLKKTSKETVSVISINKDGKSLKVLVKESRFDGFLNRLRYVFFKSRARRYWIAARGLTVRGVTTPRALALLEEKSLFIKKKTLLFTEFIDHALELNQFVRKEFNGVLSPQAADKKKQFIEECAHILRNLHEKSIYHADLKSNNILVRDENGGGWTLYFVDLDRVFFKHQLSFNQMANNLAQINASIDACISPSDRLKFFKTYAGGTTASMLRKKYYKKIIEISRKKITEPYGVNFTSPSKKAIRYTER
jgi:tRNA A-37 threonylcarbamoyl transferase component Bud32